MFVSIIHVLRSECQSRASYRHLSVEHFINSCIFEINQVCFSIMFAVLLQSELYRRHQIYVWGVCNETEKLKQN